MKIVKTFLKGIVIICIFFCLMFGIVYVVNNYEEIIKYTLGVIALLLVIYVVGRWYELMRGDLYD